MLITFGTGFGLFYVYALRTRPYNPPPPVIVNPIITPPEEEIYIAPSPTPVLEPAPQPRPVHKHKPILKHAAVPQHFAKSENIHTASNAYALPNDSSVSVSQKISDDVYDFYFSSPQDLRKAILYQEILGKPLALRD